MTTLTDVLHDLEESLQTRPERVAGLSATYELRLDGEDGGLWSLVFLDGDATLHPGAVGTPDTTLQMAAEDFVALRTGALDGATAFSQGRLRVRGDLALGMRLGQLVSGADQPVASPAPITRLAAGYMAAKYLFVANEVGVFGQLADGPVALDELAARCAVPASSLRVVLDALVGLEILERRDGGYANGASADRYLTGRSSLDFRPFLSFWNRISYVRWGDLETAVRTASGVGFPVDAEADELEWQGVAAVTKAGAQGLASTYDFSRHRRLLDLGGGNGTFGGELLGRNEGLRSTLVELPSVALLARQRLASHPCRDRFEVADCDLTSDEIPADGHDVALLANVVHVFTPDQNRTLLARLRAAVEPGTRLLLVDTWTNPDRSSPLQAALISGEYLVTNGGQAYSIPEAQAWLRDTGWTSVEHREILGITGLVMAEAG